MDIDPDPINLRVNGVSATPLVASVPMSGYVVTVLTIVPLFSSPSVNGEATDPLSSVV